MRRIFSIFSSLPHESGVKPFTKQPLKGYKDSSMEHKTYTIKDIARLAGVSAGTVDRVLHDRGSVSAASREKVQRVLDEIEYQPNMFAIGLAAKKPYCIICLIPDHIEHDYWHAVYRGICRAEQEMAPFNVTIRYVRYRHADCASYEEACRRVGQEQPDAVLIAPNFQEQTLWLAARLDEQSVPYLFIDFNIRHTHAICYIGQDSRVSGYLAAKILMRNYHPDQELVLFLNNQKSNPAEIQMQRRLEGFMEYLAEAHDHLTIHDVVLHKEDVVENNRLLDRFFATHPQAVLGAVFNSRIYQVADYLHAHGRKLDGLVGYDLLPGNVERLKSGEIDCLIAQRPAMQGYAGIKVLCDHILFKRPVPLVRHMPIDVLLKENIDFYFEFESHQ